ncbi:MAG: hypothetical protein ABL866_12770 [Devosia sp.]
MASVGSPDLFQLILVGLGSGFTVKLLDIAYQEIRSRLESRRSASRFVDEHLDPLLKSADEVVGKLVSLASEDFRSLAGDQQVEQIENHDFGSLLYLLCRFWARIEIFRLDGLSVAIASDPRGARLQSFLACLESRKVRVVDRISQRAIGELLLRPAPDYFHTIGYVEFVRKLESDEEARRWITPIADVLSQVRHTSIRQQLLLYGVVAHALIDTLDPQHIVTSRRPSYPSKLSDKTRKDLQYRVFKVYLDFVPDKSKYLWGQRKPIAKKD